MLESGTVFLALVALMMIFSVVVLSAVMYTYIGLAGTGVAVIALMVQCLFHTCTLTSDMTDSPLTV